VQELINEGQLVALIISLVQEEIEVGLSIPFLDALLEHAKRVLEEKTFPSIFAEQWDKVFAALSNAHRRTFLKYLRDELTNQRDKDSAGVLRLYGNLLLSDPSVLEEESDKVVRHWFKRILERRNPEELAWLEQLLKETKTYQTCPSETQSVFCETIKLAWEKEEDEQVKKRLQAIASAIGLRLSESHGDESGDAE